MLSLRESWGRSGGSGGDGPAAGGGCVSPMMCPKGVARRLTIPINTGQLGPLSLLWISSSNSGTSAVSEVKTNRADHDDRRCKRREIVEPDYYKPSWHLPSLRDGGQILPADGPQTTCHCCGRRRACRAAGDATVFDRAKRLGNKLSSVPPAIASAVISLPVFLCERVGCLWCCW